MNGMILAAGFGSRFRPHTLTKPKQAFPFLNLPLIYYAIALAEEFSPEKIIFNTHHLPEVIMDLVNNYPKAKATLSFSHEPQILGNGGALYPVRKQLESNSFFVLNSDTVIIPNQNQLIQNLMLQHAQSGALATLLTMEHPQAGKQYGAIWVKDPQSKQVVGFGKTPPLDFPHAHPLHFVGVRLFSPELFSFLPAGESDILKQVLTPALIAGKKIEVFNTPLTFYDGGDLPEFLKNSAQAVESLEQSLYLKAVLEKFSLPTNIRTSSDGGKLLCHPSAKVSTQAKLKGFCIIGENCIIADGCSLENVVLSKGAQVNSGQSLQNQLVL